MATAAPHRNPIVILVMSLLGAAAVANDRMAQTQGALARDTPRLGPIDLEVVLRLRPEVPGWPMLPPSGHNPSRSSREPSEPPDPRSLDWCAKSWRYQARMVSGLARRATGCSPLRPKRLPISARVARSPSESRQPGCRRVFKMRFSAARYSFCSRSSWLTNPVT